MEGKTAFISARTTRPKRLAVQAFAALQGKTVSQLIDEAIIQKAVARFLPAAAEVADERQD